MLRQSNSAWRNILPGLIISIICLAALFYLIDLDRFTAALRLADYRYIALLFAITLLWLFVRTFVWRTLLSEQASFKQVFLTLNEGYLINNLLPFRLGEIGRAFLLSKKAGLDFWQIFSTIIIERLLDVGFAAGVLFISLSAVVQSGFANQTALAAAVIFLIGLAGLYLAARNQERALAIIDTIRTRIPIAAKLIKPKPLAHFFSGLQILTDAGRFLRVIAWMAVNWGVALVQFYVLLKAFFAAPGLLWAAFTLGVMALGIAAPSSPGAIGVMEISIVGALSVFNQDPSIALAAALTAHLSNYLVTGLVGAFALAQDGHSLTSLYQDARRISNEDPTPADK